MNWWIFKDVRFHNGAACVHFILDSAGCCHFQRSFLLCLNNNVIDFVVALHLNQLVSAVLHFGEEVRVILPDATGFRIIVVYGEITLVRGEHFGKVHFLYLIALDILEEAFLFGKRIKAVCIRMEALEHFIWRKSGVFIRNHEIILCGELIIRCILRLTEQYNFSIFRLLDCGYIKQCMENCRDDNIVQNSIVSIDICQNHVHSILCFA